MAPVGATVREAGVVMDGNLDNLRQGKHLSPDELRVLIESLTPRFAHRLDALQRFLEDGRIFSLRRGQPYDAKVIQTALLSVVLANVSLLDPVVRTQQIDTINQVCDSLGISYEEVLRLTTDERELATLLAAES